MFMVLYTKDTNVSKLLHLVFLFFSQKKKISRFFKGREKRGIRKIHGHTDTRTIYLSFIFGN